MTFSKERARGKGKARRQKTPYGSCLNNRCQKNLKLCITMKGCNFDSIGRYILFGTVSMHNMYCNATNNSHPVIV